MVDVSGRSGVNIAYVSCSIRCVLLDHMGENFFYPDGDGYYLDLESLVFIVLVLKYDTCLVLNTSANYVSYVLGILIDVSVLLQVLTNLDLKLILN